MLEVSTLECVGQRIRESISSCMVQLSQEHLLFLARLLERHGEKAPERRFVEQHYKEEPSL